MAKNNKKGSQKSKEKREKRERKEKPDDALVFEGTVVEALKGRFRVEIDQGGGKHEVLAHLAGKMRRFGIKIVQGDKVNVELSEYDVSRGRIVYRLKK